MNIDLTLNGLEAQLLEKCVGFQIRLISERITLLGEKSLSLHNMMSPFENEYIKEKISLLNKEIERFDNLYNKIQESLNI